MHLLVRPYFSEKFIIMKKNNIPVRHRAYNPNKGFSYANHKGRILFMTLMMVLGFVSLLQMLQDPTSSMGVSCAGVSMATLVTLASIDDVTDRDTHGSAISYIVYMVHVSQIDRTKAFPQPDKDRLVEAIPMKEEQKPFYFEAHDIPTLVSTTEKGDITTTGENNFVIIMGGDRAEIHDFIEQYSGGKFILIFKHVKDTQWYILGELERPMILSNTETKDDKDGRYTTFTFKRSSVDLPLKYKADPSGVVASEASSTGAEGQSVNTQSASSAKSTSSK